MIDFRYHLVSLIAVFLAVALGIVIGTTGLNGPILSDVRGQVSSLEGDKRGLEGQTRQLQAQARADDAFERAVAPTLVAGTLVGRRVLIVVAADQVPSDVVDQLTTLIGQAGGTVSGRIRLERDYSDPAVAAAVQSYVNGPGVPAGVPLPVADDAGQRVAALLAGVLMVPAGRSAPASATTAISSVLAGLSALKVLAQETSSVAPSDAAIMLTAGAGKGKDAAQRNAVLVSLASALSGAGSGLVLAGDTDSGGGNGLVGVVRNNPTVSAAVSTVDNVPTAAGQISTVLALSREKQGTSGKYGTAKDTQPVPPLAVTSR